MPLYFVKDLSNGLEEFALNAVNQWNYETISEFEYIKTLQVMQNCSELFTEEKVCYYLISLKYPFIRIANALAELLLTLFAHVFQKSLPESNALLISDQYPTFKCTM